MDLHPIWLGGQILYPWSNLTGHKLLVKLGGNSLRLHCMPAWSNWVSSQWIYTQFEGGSNSIPQSNSTGQIGGKSIEIMTTKFDQAYNVISIGYHLSGFPPNLRGGSNSIPPSWIWGKSIEIMTTKFDQAYNVISIGYHPSDFHPIWGGVQIQSPQLNLTGRIWPVKLGVNPLRL